MCQSQSRDNRVAPVRETDIPNYSVQKMSMDISGRYRGLRIYITKACYMIKLNLLTLLSVDICFIYYTASFSVDSVSEPNMPSPRVEPKCKGNYKNVPRVHCFSFPKSKHLFDKWKHAIKRENFTPSPFNKVSS